MGCTVVVAVVGVLCTVQKQKCTQNRSKGDQEKKEKDCGMNVSSARESVVVHTAHCTLHRIGCNSWYNKKRKWAEDIAPWSGTNKNRDISTGPLARPFARHGMAE